MKERNPGIELLRIVSMLMIVASHSITHGNFNDFPFSLNGVFAIALSQGARIGVDCFVLITGYFSKNTSINRRKLTNQYIEILTYSILISVAMFLSGLLSVSKESILHTFLPFSSSQYWFATCYLLLMIVAPILRVFVENTSKKIFATILLILTVLWSVFPTILINAPGYSNFVWFVYLYLLGAFFNTYSFSITGKLKWFHGAGCLFIIMLLTVITYYFGKDIPFFKENSIYLFGEMNKMPALICAVALFFGFLNSKVKIHRFTKIVATCVFGVYLFHDNPYIRDFIWNKIFCNSQNINQPYFIPMLLLSILIVFSVGIVIEFLRQKIMSLFMKR